VSGFGFALVATLFCLSLHEYKDGFAGCLGSLPGACRNPRSRRHYIHNAGYRIYWENTQKINHYIAAALVILFLGGGQILLKLGSNAGKNWLSSFFNPYTLAGYLLYLLITALNIYALQGILSKIYHSRAGFDLYICGFSLSSNLKRTDKPTTRSRLYPYCNWRVYSILSILIHFVAIETSEWK
jgi:hypothetical protein